MKEEENNEFELWCPLRDKPCIPNCRWFVDDECVVERIESNLTYIEECLDK